MSDSYTPQTIDYSEKFSQIFTQLMSTINQIELQPEEEIGLTLHQKNAETVYKRLSVLEQLIFDDEGKVINEHLLNEVKVFLSLGYRLITLPLSEDNEYKERYDSFITNVNFGILIHTVGTSLDKFLVRQNLPYLFNNIYSLFKEDRFQIKQDSAREQLLNMLLIHLTSKDIHEYRKRMKTMQRQSEYMGGSISDVCFAIIEERFYPQG